MSGATQTVGTGLGGWLGYVGSTIAAIPGQYRAALRRKRARTLGLTLLAIVFFLYPVIGHYVLGPFSQSTFPLPYPDDTVATFMMIFAIMAIGLNIVAGFAGLLDLGYVAFYAIGAYCAAFLASPAFRRAGHQPRLPRERRAGRRRDPPAVLDHRDRGRGRGRHLRRAPRRADPPAARRLPGHRDPRLRRDRAALLQEPVERHLLVRPSARSASSSPNENLDRRGPGDQPDRPAVHPDPGLGSSTPARVRWRSTSGCSSSRSRILVARNLERSRIGRAWGAIREDETAAEMMGVNTVRTKLLAFALGRELRRCRRLVPGVVPRGLDLGLLRFLDLDPRPDHGHPRWDREHLGRRRWARSR